MIRVVIVLDPETKMIQVAGADATGTALVTGHALAVCHAAVDALLIQKVREELAAEARLKVIIDPDILRRSLGGGGPRG
jgi:hypothetical protein